MARHKTQSAPSRAQARRSNRLQRRISLILLASLFAGGGAGVAFAGTDATAYGAGRAFDESTAVTSAALAASAPDGEASRAAARSAPEATFTLEDGGIAADRLTVIAADNPVVRDLINGRDKGLAPAGFDPNHDVNDHGSTYPWSQCTWWAYLRRHQLGLPMGSRMGNGRDWANSARRLGYWVDNTPRVGDVMVFRAGQDGSSAVYGHVAIVEQVLPDGSVVTSECGAAYRGKPFTRTFSAASAADHEFIHY